MRKIINYRLFLILAMFLLAVNILLTSLFVDIQSKLIFIIFLISSLILILILALTLKKRLYFTLVFTIILSIILSVNYLVRQIKIDELERYNDENVVVYGRICSTYYIDNFGNLRFTIDNLKLIDESSSENISGKMYVYVNAYGKRLTEFDLGRTISFFGNIKINKMNNSDIGYISNGNIGIVRCVSEDVTFSAECKLKLNEKIRNFVLNKLENSKINYSSVVYAMLFGDSSYIENNVKTIFREGGIAHLLAVSGLHISVIIVALLFIMKKMKISRIIRFITISITLLFYSYLCNFSISVIRASLMALIAIIADMRGKHYDRLSSLSFVFSLILIINPTKMYNYSFILSFIAVLGITLYLFLFKKIISKVFNSRLSTALAVSLSVELSLLIVQLYLFDYFPVFALFSNIICVPIAIFAFVLTIIFVILSIILPFMSFSLKISDYLISIVVKFSAFISSVGLKITLNNLSIFVLFLFLIGLFVASPFINKKPNKIAIDNIHSTNKHLQLDN